MKASRFAQHTILPLVIGLSACSSMQAPAPIMTSDGVLTDAKSMTLYVFDKDTTPGKSACNGACASNWPPLLASDKDSPKGDWTIVTRDEGTKQWAYKGKPLYRWIKDKAPGDKTGEGMAGNTWHVAKP